MSDAPREDCVALRVPGRRAPLALCGGPAEVGFLEEIRQRGGRYELRLARALARVVHRRSSVMDVGAHIGAMALTAATFAPEGLVNAFEPVPATAERLRRNVERNGLGHRLPVHELALLDVDEAVTILSTAFSAGSFLPIGDGGGDGAGASERHVVAGSTLDGWIERVGLRGVDVIKVDAEGAELRVLAGAARTLRTLRPWLLVECNPPALRRLPGQDEGTLLRALQACCDRVSWIAEGGSLRPVDSVQALRRHLEREGVGNLLGGPRRPRGTLHAGAGVVWHLAKRVRDAAGLPGPRYVIEPAARFEEVRLDAPERLVPGLGYRGSVRVVNEGAVRLSSRNRPCPIRLSSRWRDEAGAVVRENPRTMLDPGIRAGAGEVVPFQVAAPPLPGRYVLCVTLVQEGYAWFDDLHRGAVATLPATVG